MRFRYSRYLGQPGIQILAQFLWALLDYCLRLSVALQCAVVEDDRLHLFRVSAIEKKNHKYPCGC